MLGFTWPRSTDKHSTQVGFATLFYTPLNCALLGFYFAYLGQAVLRYTKLFET